MDSKTLDETLNSLNSDVLCTIFSFLYPTSKNNESKVEDVNVVVAHHNQMVSLFQAIPSWKSAIGSFIPCAPCLFLKEAPFSWHLRTLTQSDVQRYNCSMEVRGGTGGEGIQNIFLDGNMGWNKWFDPSQSLPGYAEVILQQCHSIVGYAIKSANDGPCRDPADWQVLVGQGDLNGHDYQEVHSVQNHRFDRRYETHFFAIPSVNERYPKTQKVKLNISQVVGMHNVNWCESGKQISQMFIIVKELYITPKHKYNKSKSSISKFFGRLRRRQEQR